MLLDDHVYIVAGVVYSMSRETWIIKIENIKLKILNSREGEEPNVKSTNQSGLDCLYCRERLSLKTDAHSVILESGRIRVICPHCGETNLFYDSTIQRKLIEWAARQEIRNAYYLR